jgi:phosphotriesterase-related protein
MNNTVATTVLGDVEEETLGITLPHEHLLIDLSCLWRPPEFDWQEPLIDAELDVRTRGDLSLDPYVSRPNLLLDDADLAVDELLLFRDLGGRTVVDLTTHSIGPFPEALRSIAHRAGLNIVMGCGLYIQQAHPTWARNASVEQLAHRLEHDIRLGFDETGIHPGIIGEIGTGNPIHPDETTMLQAAARVQRATGLAVNVHVAIFGRRALDAVHTLDTAGADLSRVVISHMDELPDHEYHRSVLQTGAIVEFDTFGSEVTFLGSGQREPSDAQRIDSLLRLLHDGWDDQLLISQDVCTRIQLRRHGGYGYSHILRAILPQLRRHGVDDTTLETLMVRNPARLLTHPPVPQ